MYKYFSTRNFDWPIYGFKRGFANELLTRPLALKSLQNKRFKSKYYADQFWDPVNLAFETISRKFTLMHAFKF